MMKELCITLLLINVITFLTYGIDKLEGPTWQVEDFGGNLTHTCHIGRFYRSLCWHENLASQNPAFEIQVRGSCHYLC